MRRNKCLILLIVFVMLFTTSCKLYNDSKREDYFYKINSLIKDMDFFIAKASENKIELFDNNHELITEIPFEDYDDNIKFIYARKDDSVICFVISAAVDDEQGIMFINDHSNGVLDGIKSIERIGGNSYHYSTN